MANLGAKGVDGRRDQREKESDERTVGRQCQVWWKKGPTETDWSQSAKFAVPFLEECSAPAAEIVWVNIETEVVDSMLREDLTGETSNVVSTLSSVS